MKAPTKKQLQRDRRNAISSGEIPNPTSAWDMGILSDLLGFNVRRAQIELRRDFIENLGDGVMRPGAFSLLVLVGANPGIAQVELVSVLGIDKASLVALLYRLEDAGWVKRSRSTEDRRRQGAYLTPKGKRHLVTLKREMLAHERKFVELFTAPEYRQLLAYLQRIFTARQ
jgi:DNA-binding MarR family transcriptional regulator